MLTTASGYGFAGARRRRRRVDSRLQDAAGGWRGGPMSERGADPRNHLRAAARARADHTVTRLQTGIQAIQERHEPVTARTIERETGLTFKTIQRNAAAYEL